MIGQLHRAISIAVFICGLTASTLSQNDTTIVDVSFHGLKKNQEDYLRLFISQTENQILDRIQLEADAQALRNLQFFKEVKQIVSEASSGASIQYECEEIITVLPVLNFGGIEGNVWFQVGALDQNWRGRGQKLGVSYRYFDRHSVQLFYRNDRIMNSKWGLGLNLSRLGTVEPLYFDDETTLYNFDSSILEGSVGYSFSPRNQLQAIVAPLFEKYAKRATNLEQPGPQLVEERKLLLKLQHDLNRIDYRGSMLSGFSTNFFGETILSQGQGEFFKGFIAAKGFVPISKSGLIAARVRAGGATNTPSPFAPFVLDSYINIRGSGNRVFRGTGELVFNIEWRQRVHSAPWGYLQTVAFIDNGWWRPAGGDIASAFQEENHLSMVGAGVRIGIWKFYNAIFRADYGVNWLNTESRGLVLGVGQYF